MTPHRYPTNAAINFLQDEKIPYAYYGDGRVLVKETIDLSGRGLKTLPDLRCVVIEKGDFRCDNNELTGLFGCPQSIKGSFYCHDNQLTSLEGGPESVGDGYYCNDNDLETLQGAAKNVTGFDCRCNSRLASLQGGPERALSFDCRVLPLLKSLSGCPRRFEKLKSDLGDFDCFADIPLHIVYSVEERKKMIMTTAGSINSVQAAELNAHLPNIVISATPRKIKVMP